jgi:hypothetical protein
MKTIFTKPIGKSLTGSSKRHKKQRKEENMESTPRVYGRGTFFNSKKENQEAFYARRTKYTKFFDGGVTPNWPQLNSLCS